MKHSNFSRFLSVLLALVMVLSMFPATVFAADSATAELVTDVSTLAAGDQVVIVAADYDYALGTNQKSNNRAAVAVTKSGSTVTLNDSVQILTLEQGTKDNTFAFHTGTGYLYAASSSSNYLRTESTKTDNSSWLITIDASGVASVVAQGTNTRATMQYNPNNGTPLFAAYASATQKAISLYKLTDEQGGVTEPDDPEEPVVPAGPIADGDQVVIYAPAYGKALSTVKTGNYNVGVDVTLTDGVLTGFGDTEVFTVIDNGDGSFSFAYAGQNLGMADSYASMNLGAVHDDWTLTDLGSGLYNIQNVGRGNYIEWYNQYSNWSTYNSSSAATDGQFQLSFWIVTGDIPVDPEPSEPDEPEVETAT